MGSPINAIAKKLGHTIVDAKRNLAGLLEDEHLFGAVRRDPRKCVYACALKEATHADDVAVYPTNTYLRKGKVWYRYMNTESVSNNLKNFDNGKPVKSGKFKLNAPKGSTTLPEIAKRNAKRKGRHQPGNTNITRRIRHASNHVRPHLATDGTSTV